MQGRVVTRDQKLALLIGFALTLAVGVLISDHLSRGGRAELDDGLARVTDPVPPAIPSLEGVGRDDFEGDAFGRDDFEPEVVRAAEPEIAPERARPAGLALGMRPVADVPGVTVPALDIAPGRGSDRRSVGGRVHHVRPGESLFRVSEKYYGTGHLWRELAAYNEGRVGENGSVRVGVTLRIPPESELGVATSEEVVASEEIAARTRPAEPRYGEYTVRRGDTFGEISQRLMGTVRRADELLGLNSDVVRDKHLIRPGMVLRYPIGPDA